MNMHFISVATDLTEISLGSTTLKVDFCKHHVKYHQFPEYTFNPVQIHNNALAQNAKGTKFQKEELFPVILQRTGVKILTVNI